MRFSPTGIRERKVGVWVDLGAPLLWESQQECDVEGGREGQPGGLVNTGG